MRKDVEAIRALHAGNLDAARPETVAKRRKTGHWTARVLLDASLDPGSFVEYGGLSRPVRDDMTGAADGLITGTDAVDGQSCAILAYDYTVYAGTQSLINHKKHDRIFEVAEHLRLPMICWLEGHWSRPPWAKALLRNRSVRLMCRSPKALLIFWRRTKARPLC